MTVTKKLLQLHLVDQQLRGLRKRTRAAERYLAQQENLLKEIEAKRAGLQAQARQLEATVHNQENEIAGQDERIAKLREQLNTAKTNKEYSALLTEVNTFKADKAKLESAALESMNQLEQVRAQLKELDDTKAERAKMRGVAEAERDERMKEVQDRVSELEEERKSKAAEVPRDALAIFEDLALLDEENIMAPIEEHSRRHHEYACGACQVLLPIEVVSSLMGRGDLTRCVSCGVILYLEDTLKESMTTAKK